MNDTQTTDAAEAAPADTSAVHSTGIIAALATIIPASGTLVLSIGKRKDGNELVVTVQLPKTPEDKDRTVMPFQVSGTADDLDVQLAEAVQQFVPARAIALRDVADAAATMKANAKNAKTAASTPKAATSVNAPKPPKLIVSIEPSDADVSIIATDRNDKAHVITPEVPTTDIPAGRCKIKITGAGFRDQTRDVTLASDKTETVDVELEQEDQLALI